MQKKTVSKTNPFAIIEGVSNLGKAALDAGFAKGDITQEQMHHEFSRRLYNAQHTTEGRNGKPLAQVGIDAKVKRLTAEVAKYAPAPAVAAFTEAPKAAKPKAPSRKTKADLQAELAATQEQLDQALAFLRGFTNA